LSKTKQLLSGTFEILYRLLSDPLAFDEKIDLRNDYMAVGRFPMGDYDRVLNFFFDVYNNWENLKFPRCITRHDIISMSPADPKLSVLDLIVADPIEDYHMFSRPGAVIAFNETVCPLGLVGIKRWQD
jgi:hypothetical protein